MRYTIAKENEVKSMAQNGKSLEYISSVTGIPPKVIWQWCPELRPHEDIIKQSVKQRFHYIYPDLEAKISSAFSPFIDKKISDDEWEELNRTIYDVLYEESLIVFKNAITDPPNFGETKKLSNENFLDYLKSFWSENSDYVITNNLKKGYVDKNRNSVHYWSFLRTKKLKDVSIGDIEIMFEKLNAKNLSISRIDSIMNVGLIALKYAYKNGMTLLKSYEFHLPKVEKNKNSNLSNDVIIKIFNKDWKDDEAFVANFIAYNTRMQLREVRALKLGDIYTDGTIVSEHIYDAGGLQPNPNKRIIKVSSDLIELLMKYSSTNPCKNFNPDSFVFYQNNSDKPATTKKWTLSLQKACEGIIENPRNIYFSSWSNQLKTN